jgi:diguanylate cyclase (GGDEF)-like protein
LSRAETTEGERARLAELDAYEILDTPPEAAFDRVTALAARLLGAPIALVSLVADDRQWFKSRVGLEACGTPRSVSFCAHALAEDAPLVITDAKLDPRFAANPLVAGAPGVRFYAGAPLRTPRGHVIGTLCVIDTVPRPFGLSDHDRRTLADLAALVVDELELRRTDRALRESEQRLRSLTESAIDAIVCTDGDGRIVMVNPAAERMFGYAAGSMGGLSIDVIVPDRLRGAHITAWRGWPPVARRGSPVALWRCRRCAATAPSSRSRCRCTTGARAGVPSTARFARHGRAAPRGGAYPPLGPPRQPDRPSNREVFHDRLREAVAATQAGDPGFALVLVDLDRFKDVNDTYGHSAGDALLREAAERLRAACTSDRCSTARVGGDVFAVLLGGMPGPAEAMAAASLATEALSRPFRVDEVDVAIGASAGVALCPAHGEDVDALMTNADLALRRAKVESRGQPFLFDPAMGAVASARRAVCDELRRAADHREFRLRYQPQICMTTGRVVGVEALLRWQHPSRGLLAPAEFIDLIDPAGVAVDVGTWVLREACAQVRRWREAGLPELRVGVNLSAAQFRDDSLVGLVLETVDACGISPTLLELEITEGTYLGQGEAVAGPLRRLRESGVRVSFDDFGTGYASLSYLKHFPLDRLKIDRSFTRDIASDYGDAAIVRAIIGLARNLDLGVIAEGVETAEQKRSCDATAATRRRATATAGRWRPRRSRPSSSAGYRSRDRSVLARTRPRHQHPRHRTPHHHVDGRRRACGMRPSSAELSRPLFWLGRWSRTAITSGVSVRSDGCRLRSHAWVASPGPHGRSTRDDRPR